MNTVLRIITVATLLYECLGQGILTISRVEEVTTEQELNRGTAYQGGDGGLTITVAGASFDTGMTNAVKQSVINSLFTGTLDVGGTPELSVEPDGFNAHKISLVDTTTISVTTTTFVISFNAVPEFDINKDEFLNITLPDSVLSGGATVDLQPVPVQIQVSTGTIVVAKRPYENPNGQATGHVMNEADARFDRPSLFLAVSPWENWRQIDGTPAGINNVATNCTVSNRPSEPYGWSIRVKQGYLVEWHTAHYRHTNGNYLRLLTIPGLENWKYVEVFITPDPDYDISATETISFDTSCVGAYLGSGLEPNPDSKLSFDIEPTSGIYYIQTSLGTEMWETDLSLSLPCNWDNIGSSQIGNPIPNCDFSRSVNNPGFTAPDLTIRVILEKGETWLTDSTAQNELVNSFTSVLGSAFIAHVDEFLRDPISNNPRLTYIDSRTAEFSVLTWPDWPQALRSSSGSFDVTVNEYIELDLSFRTVTSNNVLYKPTKNPRGSTNPPGFTIKAAPGWVIPHGNTVACSGSVQSSCTGLCVWKNSYCVTTDGDVEQLIFTETQVRLGQVVIEMRFGSPPGFHPDTQANLGSNLYTPDVSSRTETWCSSTQPTGTVASSANLCASVLSATDVRNAFAPTTVAVTQGPIPTYWESRESTLIPNSAVTVSLELITISLSPDSIYEIWSDESVLINIPPFTGVPPVTQGIFTGSALIPVGQPANVTIIPDYGILTVRHSTITHAPSFIDLTEEQVRAGAGSITLSWVGEMWRVGCCSSDLRGGGGQNRIPQGGLRLMSDVSIFDNPFGWNNRIENATELLPEIQTVVSDFPFPGAPYGRVLTLNLQPDPFYDTTQEEHISISITDDAVVSDLSYIGRGWPIPTTGICPNSVTGCSDFIINIVPSPGRLTCLGGVSAGRCPDLTEEDIRIGGRIIYVEFELGETWNEVNYPGGFKTDLIGGLNSLVTATSEPLGWQANKVSIVNAASVNVDFSNSSRLLEITLLPFTSYDLVGVPFEEVRIEIFPRLTSSGVGVNPSVVSFRILRSEGEIQLSACIGLLPDSGLPSNPSSVMSPPQPASVDCATGNQALITNVFIPDENAYREAVIINEQDIIRGRVSLRIQLQCGESWQTAAGVSPDLREVLFKSGFTNFNMASTVLPDNTLFGNIFVPNSVPCPQTATVMLSQDITYNADVNNIIKIQLPASLFSSGLSHRLPRYLIVRPVNGIADLNIKKGIDGDSNNIITSLGVDQPITEQLIRDGGLSLQITYRAGERFSRTSQCSSDLLSMIRGQLNPTQEHTYAYKDPLAWGPGIDNVHTTVVPGSVVFQSDTVTVVNFNPFASYDISVSQNVTLDIPGSCATSGLQPWWGDESRDTSEFISQTISQSPNLAEQISGGSQYTWGFRGGIPRGAGLPGNGYFTIEPSPGLLLLEAVDGRGCSGSCSESILPNRMNEIIIEDSEIRSSGQFKLRLTIIGDTWRIATDATAGSNCVALPTSESCSTIPVRSDVCGTVGGCTCPGNVCCDPSGQKCGGSTQSPIPTNFNYKSILWYYTFIIGEDWPKPVAANAGSNMPGLAAPLIAPDVNTDSGFTARKEVVFPGPEISPTVTSVTVVSQNVIELTLYQDPLFLLKIDETVIVDMPGEMFRSGLEPDPRSVNFTFAVTPPRVTLGPRNTFTESEIRAGVTLTLTLNTGCWVDNAMELLVPRVVSDKTIASQPNGWEAMVRGPVEQNLFINPNTTILSSAASTCNNVLEFQINSTEYQTVWVGDSYDISEPETISFSFLGEMIGSTIPPIGNPTDPLTLVITPDSGGLEIYPNQVKEFSIKTCTQPIELTLRLFGERWPQPMTNTQRMCIFDSLTSISASSEFNARKSDLIQVSTIELKNPWEVSVPLQCTPTYDARNAEIVFSNIPGSCVVSGIVPGAAQGPDPARFQIEIEDAALVYLVNTQITEDSLRTGSPCVDVVLISQDGSQNDTFVDDLIQIQRDMSANRVASISPFGFNARKQTLIQPSDISIVDQNTIDPTLNRPKLRFCFRADPQFQIDTPELVTIIIRGSAVFSGIAPSYLNNVPLQFTIVPSPVNITIVPEVITEDDLRNGIELNFIMGFGESWSFNPGSCFIGGQNSRCDQSVVGVPQRSMCDCVANVNCDPALQSVVSQPYGWDERFLNIVTSTGFVFENPNRNILTLRTVPDPLFDITEDQSVRVSILGCATASGIGSQDMYLTIIKTAGKISLQEQQPSVGSTSPCSHSSCLHANDLEFNERDVRNGSISFLLRMEGDLWINRPADIASSFISNCPVVPVGGLPNNFCVAGFNNKRIDIVPSTSITIVLNANDRMLNVSFTEVPTYNIDFSERVCVNFPASATASSTTPVLSDSHSMMFNQNVFCFVINPVPGEVTVDTTPGQICESDIRLGRSSFTLVLTEEFWAPTAADTIFSFIEGNLTCPAGDQSCLLKYDQNTVFTGQKIHGGLIPTTGTGLIDTTKVVFADGPSPFFTRLFFPFPDLPMITSQPRPWYDIPIDEEISFTIVGPATASGLQPIVSTAKFTVEASVLRIPNIVILEQDIRSPTPIVFNITLSCDFFIPGSENIAAKAFYAEPQLFPALNTGWQGRSSSFLRLDYMRSTPTGGLNILQVTLLQDSVYDICQRSEEVYIDMSPDSGLLTDTELAAIFESAEPPSAMVGGLPADYKSASDRLRGQAPNIFQPAVGGIAKIEITNTPGIATMSLYVDGNQCFAPCTISERDIRSGNVDINITLTGTSVGFADPSSLVLGFNSSLPGVAGSFLDQVCRIAPRGGVLPQPPFSEAVLSAEIQFYPDPQFDIIVDELVTLSIPSGGSIYDPCQSRTWPASATTCYLEESGQFSFNIAGAPGVAISCPVVRFGAAEINITIVGTELDASPSGDTAFLMPIARQCTDDVRFGFGYLTDLGSDDSRGLTEIYYSPPPLSVSGSFRLCYRTKQTTLFYEPPQCGPIDIVGSVTSATHDFSSTLSPKPLGPFRVGLGYTITFEGRALNSWNDSARIVPFNTSCDNVGMQRLTPLKPNVFTTPPVMWSLTEVTWEGLFPEAGRYQLCYKVHRGEWKDLGAILVSGEATSFSPSVVNASEPGIISFQGMGFTDTDKVFAVWNRTDSWDPDHDCQLFFPGDALGGILSFPALRTYDDYRPAANGLITVTDTLLDISEVSLGYGVLYRPGWYHLCYQHSEGLSEPVPGQMLQVLPSITDHWPQEVLITNVLNPTPLVQNLEGWGLQDTDVTVKLIKEGQTCGVDTTNDAIIQATGTLTAGRRVSEQTSWVGFQNQFTANVEFRRVGTYYWCYQLNEFYDCSSRNPLPSDPKTCPLDSNIPSDLGWMRLPEPVVVSPKFSNFWPEFIPSGETSIITVVSEQSDIDLGSTGRVAILKLSHQNVSCTVSFPQDNAIFATVNTPNGFLTNTINFETTLHRAGFYTMCLGNIKIGVGRLGVYPVSTSYDFIPLEERSSNVNPTEFLPGSAKPMPISFNGRGLTFDSFDQYGNFRLADQFAAIPWGVGIPDEGGFYSCKNISLFNQPSGTQLPGLPSPTAWWEPANPYVDRSDPSPAVSLLEGTPELATKLVWNDTLTPGNYTLCFFDWVREEWENVPEERFFVPPNTPPQFEIRNMITHAPPRGASLSITDFMISVVPGTYQAENYQQVSFTTTLDLRTMDPSFDYSSVFVLGRFPQYVPLTDILWYDLVSPVAQAGKYDFTLLGQDNGGTLYGGNDTAIANFSIVVRGFTHAIVTPDRIQIGKRANMTVFGFGLSTLSVTGDCIRIVRTDEQLGCRRTADLPEEYQCNNNRCTTQAQIDWIGQLASAWQFGYAEGPYGNPPTPAFAQQDPTLPASSVINQNRALLKQALDAGRNFVSEFDTCFAELSPPQQSELNSVTAHTPLMPVAGEYSLCYQLSGDSNLWSSVPNSTFEVVASIREYTTHAIYSGIPTTLNFTGAGLSVIDEVIGYWVTDSSTLITVEFANITCEGTTGAANDPLLGMTNFFRGFTIPSNPNEVNTQGLQFTTLNIGQDVVRRPGFYKICYRVGQTDTWFEPEGGLLRVFSSITNFTPLEQLIVSETLPVTFYGIDVNSPAGVILTNTSVTLMVVTGTCDSGGCRAVCNSQSAWFPEMVLGSDRLRVVQHPSGDSLSREATVLMNFNTAGYYFVCWKTPEIQNCRPVPSTVGPPTCTPESNTNGWYLMENPIIVTPVYDGFTPNIVDAGATTTITVQNVDPGRIRALGPASLSLRNNVTNYTSCRDVYQNPSVDEVYFADQSAVVIIDNGVIQSGPQTGNRTGTLSFPVNVTRAGDYDVCIGMTRVGNFTGLMYPAWRQNAFNTPSCQPWRGLNNPGQTIPQFCQNTTSLLQNRVFRVQPRPDTPGYEPSPNSQRFHGSPINVTVNGWGYEQNDVIFVMNGTSGELCSSWNQLGLWNRLGYSSLSRAYRQVRGTGGQNGAVVMSEDNIEQGFGIVQSNWSFTFPRPGIYKLCHWTSLYGWSQEISPLFEVASPVVTDWDWIPVSRDIVLLKFYGYGLSSLTNIGDRLLIVQNDLVPAGLLPCQVVPTHFSVVANTNNLGPLEESGVDETDFLWSSTDINSYPIKNYTMCYANCWQVDIPLSVQCTDYTPLTGTFQAPFRNFKPTFVLSDTGANLIQIPQPCSGGIIQKPLTLASPGRPQEDWVTRSNLHKHNITFTVVAISTTNETWQSLPTGGVAYPEIIQLPAGNGYVLSLPFRTIPAVATHEFEITAIDDGGTEFGGVDKSDPQRVTIDIVGNNTAPVFSPKSDRIPMAAPASGVVVSPEILSSPALGGVHPYERDLMVFWYARVVTGNNLVNALPTFNGTFLTLDLRPGWIPGTEILIELRGCDTQAACQPNAVSTCNGQSSSVQFKLILYPPNTPPVVDWKRGDVILAYADMPYEINHASVTVGTGAHEMDTQTLLQPTIAISNLQGTGIVWVEQPSISAEGVLKFTVGNDSIKTPPVATSVIVSFKDDGGVRAGGQDTTTQTVQIVPVQPYTLSVTPVTAPYLRTPVSMTISGGLNGHAMFYFYIWLDSSLSRDITKFNELRSQSSLLQIAGPQRDRIALESSLPVGDHTVFGLLFMNDIDWTILDTENPVPCPVASGSRYGIPCLVVDTVTITSSDATVDEAVSIVDALSSSPMLDASTAFASAAFAASQLSSAANSSESRDSLLDSVSQVASRISSSSVIVSASDLANGGLALTYLIGNGSGPALSSTAAQNAIATIELLSTKNYDVWSAACHTSLLMPYGSIDCDSHKKLNCTPTACGNQTSDSEFEQTSGVLVEALGSILASTTSAVAPDPWVVEADKTRGQSQTSLVTRRSAALLMTDFLRVAHAHSEKICNQLLSAALQNALLPNATLIDSNPYIKQVNGMTFHVSGIHSQATTSTSTQFTLSNTQGTSQVTSRINSPIVRANSTVVRSQSCRSAIAMFDKLPLRGDGNPEFTPYLPVVSVRVSNDQVRTDTQVNVDTSFELPIPTALRSLGAGAALSWNTASTLWIRSTTAASSRGSTSVTVTGPQPVYTGYFQLPSSRLSIGTSILQSSENIESNVVAASSYNDGKGICFACTALPVYWGLFVFFIILALVIGATRDTSAYGKGSPPVSVESSTSALYVCLRLHMWSAPMLVLPYALGYHTRVRRVVVLFTFFGVALGMSTTFYSNSPAIYSWEATVDGARAITLGMVAGIVGEIVAVGLLLYLFPRAKEPIAIKMESEDDDIEPLKSKHQNLATEEDLFHPKGTKLKPAVLKGSHVAGEFVFSFIFTVTGSVLVIFLTKNYSEARQGEQVMLTFLVACIVHYILEIFRSVVLHKKGTYEGAKFAKIDPNAVPEETHNVELEERRDLFEQNESYSDPPMERKPMSVNRNEDAFWGGTSSARSELLDNRVNPDEYNQLYKSHTQAMMNTGGFTNVSDYSSRPIASSPLAARGRAAAPRSIHLREASISNINRRGLGRGGDVNGSISGGSELDFIQPIESYGSTPRRGTGRGTLSFLQNNNNEPEDARGPISQFATF